MAVIETWIKTDLQSIVKIKMMHGILFSQDNMANLIGVELLDGGEPATVSGSVSANVLRADGTTVAVAGTLSGNLASVTLPQAAYAVPGTVAIAIKLTTGSTVTTIGAIQSVVYRTSSDTIIDPGTIIPSVQDLIAAIEDAVESIPPDYSELTGEVSDLKNAINEKELTITPSQNFSLVEYPSAFTGTFKPVNVYFDGEKYTTDFNPDKFKNTGGTIRYAAPINDGGISTNTGTSRQSPWNLYAALNRASNGDTVYLLPGYYTSNDTGSLTKTQFDKSINIIGLGNVVWCIDGVVYKALASKAYDSTNKLWTCTRSSCAMVISSQDYKFKYTQKSSIADCKATPKSWYFGNGTVYINDTEEPDAIISTVRDGVNLSPSANCNIYFENILFLGGSWSVLGSTADGGSLTAIFHKCIFTRGYGSHSTFRATGGNYLFNECEASFSPRDGFAYSPSTGATVNFFEINCIGSNNGLQKTDTQSISNGSTAHSGAKGIRVNGVYENNWGANVADVQTDTMSVNFGCVARNSCGSDSYNEGFSAQQPGTTMWLYNCKASGNLRDINATTINGVSSTLYAIDCDFQTMTIGAGNIIVTGGRVLQSGSDLNDYSKEGLYRAVRGSIAQTLLNCPVTTLFIMQVIPIDPIYIRQIIWADDGIYSRRRTSYTAWGAWRHASLVL